MQITRSLSLITLLASGMVVAAVAPHQAQAQMTMAGPKPLVVVRFNQPNVYYDKQLYSAVSQAVTVKPEVMFDVVSNAPSTGDQDKDAQWIRLASQHTQAVVASLQKIGVPMERMRVTGHAQSGIKYDETQIFVR